MAAAARGTVLALTKIAHALALVPLPREHRRHNRLPQKRDVRRHKRQHDQRNRRQERLQVRRAVSRVHEGRQAEQARNPRVQLYLQRDRHERKHQREQRVCS